MKASSTRSAALKRYWRRFTPTQRTVIALGGPVAPRRGRSSLELVTAKVLKMLRVPFEEQAHVAGYRVDFYLPDRLTVVEVDGAYWHSLWNRPRTEVVRDAEITAAGYSVVRLAEAALKEDPLSAVMLGLGLLEDY